MFGFGNSKQKKYKKALESAKNGLPINFNYKLNTRATG